MFLHSQFKTITNIPKQTLYIFPKTILSINISEIYKKERIYVYNKYLQNKFRNVNYHLYKFSKNQDYTNFEFISLFFLLNYRKKESFPNKYCVNFVLFQKKLSKKAYKGKTRLALFTETTQIFRKCNLD